MGSDAFTDATSLDDDDDAPGEPAPEPRPPAARLPLQVVALPERPPWGAPAWQRAAGWERRCRAAERQLRSAREVLARQELARMRPP